MIIEYNNIKVELKQLPDGSYEKPPMGLFTKTMRASVFFDKCRVKYTNGNHPRDLYGESYMRSGHGKIRDNNDTMCGRWSEGKRTGVYVNKTGRFPGNLLIKNNILDTNKTYKQATRTYRAGTKASMLPGQSQNVYKNDKLVVGSQNKFSRFFALSENIISYLIKLGTKEGDVVLLLC